MTLPYAEWLPHQRWYAGRGRDIADLTETRARIADDLDDVLLDVHYTDGTHERYQVIIGWDRVPSDEFIGVARIGRDDGRVAFDALYDQRSARELLDLIRKGGSAGGIQFEPEPDDSTSGALGGPADRTHGDADVVTDPTTRVIDAEQSNSSVVYDAAAILKLFRRVVPGVNPDLELNRVLGRNGSPYSARLLGAMEAVDADGQPLSLATVTEFAPNAADGWAMATASARDLLAEADGRAAQAGGDFAGEAHRLGEAVASVHVTLGTDLGHELRQPPVHALIERQRAAAAQVPELESYVDDAIAALQQLTNPTIVQRIHGDLHLGQTLRTPEHWILIDFEGEPGQPMEERRRMDSPMRDVAGMLRSFDYAAFQLLGAEHDDVMVERAEDWATRNRKAFCDGYAAVAGVDPREHADLLFAYELDKAAYEAVYESRHRPSWRWIPLRAVDRLLTPAGRRLSTVEY